MSDAANAATVSETNSGAAMPQTSVDHYQQTEVTARFRRWTAMDGTAYQRGQEAGFRYSQVRELERRGVVEIVHRAPGTNRMVRKGV